MERPSSVQSMELKKKKMYKKKKSKKSSMIHQYSVPINVIVSSCEFLFIFQDFFVLNHLIYPIVYIQYKNRVVNN